MKNHNNCGHCKDRFEPFVMIGYRGHTVNCPVGKRLYNKYKEKIEAKFIEEE